MKTSKKLIEVVLPLDAINAASVREKSIRHGHPSALHPWWARRPLAAARAVIFSQMVDDPSAHLDWFPTEKAQAREKIRESWRRTCIDNADHPRVEGPRPKVHRTKMQEMSFPERFEES